MATNSSPANADAPPPDPTQSQYGYLFLADKTPTPMFTAFLYAMAQYIVSGLPVSSRSRRCWTLYLVPPQAGSCLI